MHVSTARYTGTKPCCQLVVQPTCSLHVRAVFAVHGKAFKKSRSSVLENVKVQNILTRSLKRAHLFRGAVRWCIAQLKRTGERRFSQKLLKHTHKKTERLLEDHAHCCRSMKHCNGANAAGDLVSILTGGTERVLVTLKTSCNQWRPTRYLAIVPELPSLSIWSIYITSPGTTHLS